VIRLSPGSERARYRSLGGVVADTPLNCFAAGCARPVPRACGLQFLALRGRNIESCFLHPPRVPSGRALTQNRVNAASGNRETVLVTEGSVFARKRGLANSASTKSAAPGLARTTSECNALVLGARTADRHSAASDGLLQGWPAPSSGRISYRHRCGNRDGRDTKKARHGATSARRAFQEASRPTNNTKPTSRSY
jgi:hypothetical protein